MRTNQMYALVLILLGGLLLLGIPGLSGYPVKLASVGTNSTTTNTVCAGGALACGMATVTQTVTTAGATTTKTVTTDAECAAPIIYSDPAECPQTTLVLPGNGPVVDGTAILGGVLALLGIGLFFRKGSAAMA